MLKLKVISEVLYTQSVISYPKNMQLVRGMKSGSVGF